MKSLLAIFVASSMVGCQSVIPASQSQVASTSPSASSESLAAPFQPSANRGESTASVNSAVSQSASPSKREGPPPSNPRRFFQLKDLRTVQIKVAGNTITVWVMDSDAKRQEGMMFLTNGEVNDEEGMLFVFPDVQRRSFWMSNTVLPLDLAYLDAKGKILNIAQGKPFDESPIPSAGPSLYVLEMKQGMMKKLGIEKGMVVTIPANVKSED
jgi:hypothetical protein